MFFYVDFLIALLVALFITGMIAAGMRKSVKARRYLSWFVLILLAAWAGGLWVAPIGPDFAGVYVLTVVVVALIMTLILAVGAYPYYPLFQREEKSTIPDDPKKIEPVGPFFWVLLAVLILAVIAGYLWPARVVW